MAVSGDKIPGDGGDSYHFLWFFWWFKKALLNLSSPYYTTLIFYPTGINLAFSSLTPFNSILSIPLQMAFGLIIAYNILWITSFIVSGYGTFLLVRYLTGNKQAAFVSGIIFMFSPYHFAHALGHLNLTAIEWIPFYILYLFKIMQENKARNAIYAAFFLFLTALCEYYYLIYLLFFTMIFFFYYLLIDKKNMFRKNILKRLFIMAVTFGLLFSPFAYPLFEELLTSRSSYMYTEKSDFYYFSADILAFFIPTQFHPIFKEFVSGGGAEFTVFAGYTVLFLSLFACIKIRTKEIRFWALSTIVFFIFSLGPILHINGVSYNFVKLPYSIIMNIPIISIARVPSRWDVLVMLSLAVLAGYGLNYILIKSEGKFFNRISKKHILPILFACLILFEFLAIPYPMTSGKVPEFYYKLKNDPEDNAILEVPGSIESSAHYMYYQTVHGKKIVNGYTSRIPFEKQTFLRLTPFINQLSFPSDNKIINKNITEIGQSILNHYNIRYIILHENSLPRDHIIFVDNLLKNISKKEPEIYKEDGLIVYTIEKSQPKSFMLIQENWVRFTEFEGHGFAWISNNATIFSYTPESRESNLSFIVLSYYKPRTLQIYLNDQLIYEQIIETNFTKVYLPIRLKEGGNMIKFYTPNDCQRPIDIPEINDKVTECLSLGFTNVGLK